MCLNGKGKHNINTAPTYLSFMELYVARSVKVPLPTQARAQAKAGPGQALGVGLGFGLRNPKPRPAQARPKPWLSGQARPRASLFVGKFYVGGMAPRTALARSVLNTLSSENLGENAAWRISWGWIKYLVSSIPPSAELLPLIRQINPVFLFFSRKEITELRKTISWFQLWEDYIFMDHFFSCLRRWDSSSHLPPSSNRTAFSILECEEAFTKSPGFFTPSADTRAFRSPFILTALLDMSWEELRSIVSSLRDILGEDEEKLRLVSIFMQAETRRYQWAAEHKIIVHGCLLKDVGSSKLDFHF
ncbi:hypothetical protein B0H17DRAFT_1251449 [Mycena rosella]|uniref:Uncharacterized protein n=1 Tax=Mycena rosella TaxID=1033263 RepID=A0AAD7DV50_MYCRO|nr:hypothetical protein B0H17DRAFT_1251449 [Mycena rosella]